MRFIFRLESDDKDKLEAIADYEVESMGAVLRRLISEEYERSELND